MVNKKNDVPKGWLKFTSMGQRIEGTNIIAFKVPLRTAVCERKLDSDAQWFTPAILLRSQPQIKAVIDLTNTDRYYDPEEFRSEGIDHFKIMAAGQGEIPPAFKIREFFDAVEYSLEKHSESPDALIGVHCTHGLNRTGYFVCRWMVDRMKMTPDEAISRFEEARGHKIERQSYISSLKSKNVHTTAPKSKNIEYASPLADPYNDEDVQTHSRNYRYRSRSSFISRPPCRSDSDTNWRSREPTSASSSDNNDIFTKNKPNSGLNNFGNSSRPHPSSNKGDKKYSGSRGGKISWR